MRIRKAEIADAEELTALARLSKASWGYPETWLAEWESELLISGSYIEDHLVFVVEDVVEVVGMVGVEVGEDGPEIGHLWVAAKAQGRGVGRALVAKAKGVAREHGWAALRVVSDPNARGFYERMGAVQVGEVVVQVLGMDRTLPLMSLSVERIWSGGESAAG